MGKISYSYRDDLTVLEKEGTTYVYYNDTSFFFTDSTAVIFAGDFDEAQALEYYTAAEQSFNMNGWSNGKMVTEINMINVNGLEVWICDIEMDHESGVPFGCSATVLYADGVLTSFTLISDLDSYESSANEFADTILSLTAVP